MKNTTEMTWAGEWIEAICQILADAGDLLGLTVREQGPSDDPPGPYPTAGNGQMLLPGIADPHRWDLGHKGSGVIGRRRNSVTPGCNC